MRRRQQRRRIGAAAALRRARCSWLRDRARSPVAPHARMVRVRPPAAALLTRRCAVVALLGVCAVGALVVYDITKDVSFENVEKWLAELKENATADITMMLVGNKTDLAQQRAVSTEQGKAYAVPRDRCRETR